MCSTSIDFLLSMAQKLFYISLSVYNSPVWKIQKHGKIFLKIFIVSKRSLGHTASNMGHLFVVGEFVVVSHLKIFPLQLLGPAEKSMAGPSSSKGKILMRHISNKWQ